MKYAPKTYAKAFAEVAAALPAGQEKTVINNFIATIKKNGDMLHIDKIVYLAEKMFLEKNGRSVWTAETARPLKNLRSMLKGVVENGDVLEEKIDKNIVAGIRLTRNDEAQFDASLKTKIESLFL